MSEVHKSIKHLPYLQSLPFTIPNFQCPPILANQRPRPRSIRRRSQRQKNCVVFEAAPTGARLAGRRREGWSGLAGALEFSFTNGDLGQCPSDLKVGSVIPRPQPAGFGLG